LKELLRERLIECGWRDELKAQCRYGCPVYVSFHLYAIHFIESFGVLIPICAAQFAL
jgi:hypothetical protein